MTGFNNKWNLGFNNKWDHRFLGLAKEVASWSKDPSTQVGAVIVRSDKTIASVGFNGFPKQMDDADRLYTNREEKLNRIIHAEINAILFANEKLNGYTIYTWPFLCCDRCFSCISQAGITRIVAPIITNKTNWDESFVRVRSYAEDMGIRIDEIEF